MLKLCHLSTWALLSLQLLPTSASNQAQGSIPVHKRNGFTLAFKTPSKGDLVYITGALHKGRLPMMVPDGSKIGPDVSIGTPSLPNLPLFVSMGDPSTIVFIKGVNTQHAFYDPTRSSTVVRLPGKSDRNGVHGKYYTDVFTVGDLPAVRQNFIGIVSTDGNRSLDDWQDSYGFGGQLGLGLRDNESMVGDTFMEGLFKAGAISKKLFALQVSIDSFIQFGAINHTAYVDNILWSPVLTHVGGWAVQSDGYVINNKVVPNTGGPLQFETAATYTTIPERIASKLFAHIDHKLSKFDWDSTSAQLLFKCHISDKETVGYSIKGRKYSLPLKTLINREVSLPCDMRRRPLDSAALIISGATVMAIETDNEVANKSHRSMISSLFMQRFYGIFDSEHDDGKPAVGLALSAGW